MRRVSLRLLLATLTFILGVSASWATRALTEIKAEMVLARVAPNFVFRKSGPDTPCGWIHDYALLDGSWMFETNMRRNSLNCQITPKFAQRDLKAAITDATQVISHVPNGKNRFGKEGERVELLYFDEIHGERAKIIWYDGDTNILEINAPTLEIARGFEVANPE